ncbi:uncharacterized protein LOC120138412 [Hibiscus syriacus]|uniref:uncharacterized protein LOC120138412 n=1 Tax=Hibiscus syriacus TaxID=106335 RepID=UPI00192169C5|nr:uncharacterized protein LOC120138412 [Hibiscus syriacus]
MAILERLPTRERLLRMGIQVDSGLCVICGREMEKRNHLFLGCVYAKHLWGSIRSLCSLSRNVGSWGQELDWALSHLKGKSLIVLILKLAWSCFVYSVWEERNFRLFRGKGRLLKWFRYALEEEILARWML